MNNDYYFIYNGRSSLDFGLLIEDDNFMSSAPNNIESKDIEGREGNLLIKKEGSPNITKWFKCDIRPDKVGKTLYEVAEELKNWLQSNTEYSDLISSDNPLFKYEAIYSGSVDPQRAAINFGAIMINFDCKPYKISTHEVKLTLTEPRNYFNRSLDYKPKLKIYGSGDIIIKINNQELDLRGIDDYIIVDSQLMNAYKLIDVTNEMVNQNQKMYSVDFPIIKKGDNSISWVGDVKKIEVTISEVIR